MMSNMSSNYTYVEPPTREYQEFGIYDTTNDPAAVSFVNVPTIYSIQYTGVTAYEFNGTTYYYYNVYDAPVLSSLDCNSLSSDFSSEFDTNVYNELNVLEQSIDFNENDLHEVCEEQPFISEESTVLDWSVEVEESDLENVVDSYPTIYATNTKDDEDYVNNHKASNELEQSTLVGETDLYEDCEEQPFIWEESKVLDWSVEVEDSDLENEVDSYPTIYATNTKDDEDDVNNHKEANELEQSTLVGETDLYEDCEEQPFIWEESKVLDWSVEVEDSDLENEVDSYPTIYATNTKDDEDDVNNHKEANELEQSTLVGETDLYEDCEEQPFIWEESKVLDWSVEVEDSDLENEADSYPTIYATNTKDDEDDVNNHKEANELEQSTLVGETDLYEDCEEQPFIWEESKVFDWSVEVEDVDDEEFIEVKSSKENDLNINLSPSVVKYFKENLYLRALSGHLYLKESLPVVDILPVIEEESEPGEEDNTSEWTVDDGLEHNEEKIPPVMEKNKVSDVIFNTSEQFIEKHSLDSLVDEFKKVEKKLPNLIQNDSKSVPIFNVSQQEPSNSEHKEAQSEEIGSNNDRLPINVTKLFNFMEDSTSLSCGEKSETFVEKFSKPTEAYPNFNAALKIPEMHESGKENLSKIQNDSINTMKESAATRIEPLCCNDHALLEEVEKRKDIFSNPVDRNHLMNTTCHAPEETGPRGECYSEQNVENTIESKEKVSRKTGKKKFNTFRKWLSNLCCCARKDS